MKYNKKAMETSFLILLIVGIVTLVLLIMFIYNYVDSYMYTEGIIGCNMFVKGIEGKPVYFNNSLSTPSSKLIDSLSVLCPSKTVQVSEKNIGNAVELVKDCYFKMNNGKDFLGANTENINFCLYCGRIESEDEFNFGEKFKEELENEKYKELNLLLMGQDKETTNYNEFTLDDGLPEMISKEKSVEVYYRIDRGEAGEVVTKISTWFSRKIGNLGMLGSLVNYVSAENKVETYTSVILYNEGMSEENKLGDKDGCYYVIPNKNYD